MAGCDLVLGSFQIASMTATRQSFAEFIRIIENERLFTC